MLAIYIDDGGASQSGGQAESGQAEAGGAFNLRDVLSSAGAQRGGGSAAFLDINYGKSAAEQVSRPGGTAAFLDINYGKSAAEQVSRPGGTAAFLDINYGKSAAEQVARPESAAEGEFSSPSSLAGGGPSTVRLTDVLSSAGAQRPGGTAAFLDINYGKSAAEQVSRPGGTAAFLDINYGKSVADQVARPESGQTQGGAQGLSLYFIDGHLHLVSS
jgi:hypothetical protein